MVRKWLGLLVLLLFAPSVMHAHGPGSVSFLKINGQETKPYFLEDVGVLSSAIPIPKDTLEQNFLVNEEIVFTIDTHKVEEQFPEEDVSNIQLEWDFGDGTKKKGVEQKHVYKKPGSYFLTVTSNKEELSENVLLHVLPRKDYALPQAVITVNGTKGTSENYNILDFDLNKTLTFDASESHSGSSKIVAYTWDFGDEESAEGKTVKHQYELPQAFATTVLRVEDENGLVSDAFVNIRNSGSNEPNNPRMAQLTMIAGPLLLAIIAAIVGIILRSKRKKKSA